MNTSTKFLASLCLVLLLGTLNTFAQSAHASFTWLQPAPNTIQFSNTSTGSYPVADNFWEYGDNTPLESGVNPKHVFNVPGTYRVLLLIADTTTWTIYDSVSQVVSVSGTVICNMQSSNSSIIPSTCQSCADGSGFVSTSGGTTPYTYSWTNSAVTNNFPMGMTGGTYYCTITDANGCSTVDSMTIPTGPPCSAGFTWTEPSANHWAIKSTCKGLSNSSSVILSVNGAYYANMAFDSIKEYIPAGRYEVCITMSNFGGIVGACTNSYCDSVIISGPPACSAAFTLTADSLNPGKYTAVNNASGAGPLKYYWYWGDGSMDTVSATPSHTYAGPGFYSICLYIRDTVGCSSYYCDSTALARLPAWAQNIHPNVNVVMGKGATGILTEPSLLNSFNAYPSPSSGAVNIAYSLMRNATVEIKLFNLQGQELMQLESERTQEAGAHEIHAELGSLDQGTYFIRIMSNGMPETKWISIVR